MCIHTPPIGEFTGEFYDYQWMSDLFKKDPAKLEQQMNEANESDPEHIEDQILRNIVKRLEKNWNSVKVKLYNIFENNHFFMDDMFSSSAHCIDILSYLALDWLNTKTKLYNIFLTKYFWIAGDLNQLTNQKQMYTFEKFFISFKDEQNNIHMGTVYLDAVCVAQRMCSSDGNHFSVPSNHLALGQGFERIYVRSKVY